MQVLKFKQYKNSIDLATDFLDLLGSKINEDNVVNDILNKVTNDLKLNFTLITSFGTGISFIYPIVDNLIKNSKLNIDMSIENIVLLTITSISIFYLESRKGKVNEKLEKEVKNLLEELKLRGIGNGIVKKLTECLKALNNIFIILLKNTYKTIESFVDMFSYTSILVPILSAITTLVSKNNYNLDTFSNSFISLGIGITTLTAKHGLNWLIQKLKNKIYLNNDINKNIATQIDDTPNSNSMINES
jgi:hypothetical protein